LVRNIKLVSCKQAGDLSRILF